jgi:hypothetical protein
MFKSLVCPITVFYYLVLKAHPSKVIHTKSRRKFLKRMLAPLKPWKVEKKKNLPKFETTASDKRAVL